jgi:UDP-N-acetylmuramoyl-L-alanyl-D-glutamate--2,6-diaminopimelate ligase
MFKSFIKKIIPKSLLLFYHKCLAYLASIIYNWPSKKMILIGVTGTTGKSTVVNLIGKVLEEAGYSVGLSSTFNFKIKDKEWLNKTKMTMPGRFFLQRFLNQVLKSGCQYAIIETSSEGIAQSRHLGIDYDILVFTNLKPEHIESHGGFEKYKETKGRLFKELKKRKNKIINGKEIKKKIIVNLDDEYSDYFLNFEADEYFGYQMKGEKKIKENLNIVKAENVMLKENGLEFFVNGVLFKSSLMGEFNVYNLLAAITVGLSLGLDLELIKKALEKVKVIPGRLEIVIEKPFKVIVDYAHTPDALEKVYQFLNNFKKENSKIIAVLGSAGGGRDKWKRPILGMISEKYADEIIITNEDPYDEDPLKIINEIAAGIKSKKFYKIVDRSQAIEKALSLAKENDVVIITGKGAEQWIIEKEKKIPWDDREKVKEIFKKLKF